MMKRMSFAALVCGAVLFTSPLMAQEKKENPFAKLPIGVVNFQRVAAESKVHQNILEQHEKLVKAYKDEVARKEQDLKKQETELRSKETVLSPDEFKRQAIEFNQKVMAVQAEVQEKDVDMRSRLALTLEKLEKEHMLPILEKVVTDKGLQFLFQSQVVFLFNSDYEVTNDVIKMLNDRVSKMPLATSAQVKALKDQADKAKK